MEKSDTLVIFASPRKNGNTATLLDAFLAKGGVAEYQVFDCYDELPRPCYGCGYCNVNFGCKNRDLDEFYSLLENASRIIIASPVYNAGFPAPMKALIDRLQVYFAARFERGVCPPVSRAKTADILITSGSDSDNRETILAGILPAFTVINTKLNRCFFVNGTDNIKSKHELAAAIDSALKEV